MRFEPEIAAARDAARAAGAVIARHSGGTRRSWDKAADSPVTQTDLEANEAILHTLRAAFPADAILSEETSDSAQRRVAERVWIIDPLDGTKEFIEGIPEFSVSIALAVRGEPVVGCVYQPLTQECFFGSSGSGAFLSKGAERGADARRLEVSRASGLAQCRVLCSRTELGRGQLDAFKDLFAEIRPVGSVALKLAFVAASRGDLWVSAAPKSEWDVCAGDLLLREAGGVFLTLDRGVRSYNQADVLLQPLMFAGPRALVEELRRRSPES